MILIFEKSIFLEYSGDGELHYIFRSGYPAVVFFLQQSDGLVPELSKVVGTLCTNFRKFFSMPTYFFFSNDNFKINV